MKQVLICNSSAAEIDLIQVALGKKFTLHSMTRYAPGTTRDIARMDAVVVDANFTDAQGLDFIMEVNASAHLPVLIVTPPDDPHCAIEARRIGVFNYLVKTEKIYSVLEIALNEATEKFNDEEELKRTVLAQRERILELEKQLSRTGSMKALAPSAPPPPDDAQSRARKLLEAIVARLRKGEVNLPSYPETSIKLSRLMRDQAGIGRVARMLEEDVAVAARLIGVSNSARYRGVKPNRTVEQAISILGLSATKNYVDLIANRALYVVKNPRYQPMLKELWEHSVASAHAARLIAELAKVPEPDEVFSMGMLHDIGELLLIQAIAEMEADGQPQAQIDDAELTAFLHQHHGFFGRKLLEIWKLPKSHAEAAHYHEALDMAPCLSKELHVIHLANLLSMKAGFGKLTQENPDAEAHRSAMPLKLDLNTLIPLENELTELMRDTAISLD